MYYIVVSSFEFHTNTYLTSSQNMKNVKKLGRERSNFLDLMLIESTNITRPFLQKLKFYKKFKKYYCWEFSKLLAYSSS